MAYIRVPTGLKTVTVTASSKGFIYYICPKCGNPVLHEHTLQQQAEGTYHAFQSARTKNQTANSAANKANNLLEQQDAALYTGINVQHNYECVNFKVKCPYCNEIQPWSNIPRKWTKTPFFVLWIMGLALVSMLALSVFDSLAAIPFVFAAAALALLPLIRSRIRKNKIKRTKVSRFVPPIYYNKFNIQDLISGPASELLKNRVESSNNETPVR